MNLPIELELAREIARQGEARLAAIMSLATAADLRATTLCSIFGTSSVALTAAVLASIATSHATTGLILGGFVGATGLFMAAFFAANAGAPRDLFIAGGKPIFSGNGRGMPGSGAPKWKCWMRLPIDTQHPSPPIEIS